jgi:hypothetical protein
VVEGDGQIPYKPEAAAVKQENGEHLYGNLRKQPLVKHWEGETMIVDITRKVPAGDKLYEWYRR